MTTALRTRAALCLPVLLLVGACGLGGGDPAGADEPVAPAAIDAAQLSAGGCRSAAPLLDQVRQDVFGLRADAGTAGTVRTSLEGSQQALAALPAPGGDADRALGELGQALGFLRLGIDTHSYEEEHLARVDDAVTGTVEACQAS